MYREGIGNQWLNWNPYDEQILAEQAEEESKKKNLEMLEELYFIEEAERERLIK